MLASLRIGNTGMMAYDGMGSHETGFKALFSLMLGLADRKSEEY